MLLCSALVRRTAACVARRPIGLPQLLAISTPRAHLIASCPAPCSSSSSIHTTAALAIASKTWGGGKLKTHKGASKRFVALGKRRVLDKRSWSTQSGFHIRSPAQIEYAKDQRTITRIAPASRQIGVVFKGRQACAQHAMTKKGNRTKNRKGQPVIHRRPSVVKLLSRLIGFRKRK